MVVHHWRLRERHWQAGLAINGVGAVATFIVLLVVVISKFTIGAWIPVVLIPVMVLVLQAIGRHYDKVAPSRRRSPTAGKPRRYEHLVVVLVGTVNKAVLNAVTYARSLAPDRLIAVNVVADADEQAAITSSVGGTRPPHRAAHHLLALPRTHPARPRLPRRARRRITRRHHHRRHPRVRDQRRHPVAPQPERPRPQSSPALPPPHRRPIRPHPRTSQRHRPPGPRPSRPQPRRNPALTALPPNPPGRRQ